MSSWYEKYRDRLKGEGFRTFAEQVERPGIVRVRPLRLAGWDHALWVPSERSSDFGA
jgi:hypothetical protein